MGYCGKLWLDVRFEKSIIKQITDSRKVTTTFTFILGAPLLEYISLINLYLLNNTFKFNC